jgi:hypothetical protein
VLPTTVWQCNLRLASLFVAIRAIARTFRFEAYAATTLLRQLQLQNDSVAAEVSQTPLLSG